MHPEPLPRGFLLNDRFEVCDVLGRGGFGIAYLTRDLQRQDQAVVKELAPSGSKRERHGALEIITGATSPHALRQRFTEEARLLSRLKVRGVLPVRATFAENATAYYATEYVEGARSLDDLLRTHGPMHVDGAMDMFLALLEVLDAVHKRGVLHRDIKPSNVLLHPSEEVTLIDFGSAREYLKDAVLTQTVMYTPGYAPPEQLSERARRGPASDLYALCATLYHALAGMPPPDAAERISGITLPSIRELRPDVDEATARTLERGLALAYGDRPQTAAELRATLDDRGGVVELEDVAELDRKLFGMKSFVFERRACPSCDGLIDEARPLRKGACPVCRRGVVRRRQIDERACPICRGGGLKRLSNADLPAVCPRCSRGVLAWKRKALLGAALEAACPTCDARFETTSEGICEAVTGETHTREEWLRMGGRSKEVVACRECSASFDVLADGRMRQVEPPPKSNVGPMFPEEWARVAAGLEPGVGNAECDACGADYFVEGDTVTLLDSFEDPHDYAKHYLGRLVRQEDVRWLAVGKESPNPGLICDSCDTEFDTDGIYLRLVKTENPHLARHIGEPRKLDDWHRLAAGIPPPEMEAEMRERLDHALRDSYRTGSLSMDDAGTLWRGEAIREGAKGTLVITPTEVTFGGLLRKWRAPLHAVHTVEASGDHLAFTVDGMVDTVEMELSPVRLIVELRSGDRVLELSAEDLALRLGALG
jgi:predicted Ser/Thr protein kinase